MYASWPFADEPAQFDEDCYCKDGCVLIGPHEKCEVVMTKEQLLREVFILGFSAGNHWSDEQEEHWLAYRDQVLALAAEPTAHHEVAKVDVDGEPLYRRLPEPKASLAPFVCAKCGIPASLDPLAGQFAHDRGAPHDHHPIRPAENRGEKP